MSLLMTRGRGVDRDVRENNGHETGDDNPVNNQLNTVQHAVQGPLTCNSKYLMHYIMDKSHEII